MTTDNMVRTRMKHAASLPVRADTSSSLGRGEVLVGVDGSAAGFGACQAASHEADLRGWPLRVVRIAGSTDDPDVSWGVLTVAVRQARASAPNLTIRADEIVGHPAGQLIELSSQAGLLVLGRANHESLMDAFAGSISEHVATHARCPVLLAGMSHEVDPLGSSRPLVVGIDGSASSYAAFAFAVSEARLRGVGIIAVHAPNRFDRCLDPLYDGLLADVGTTCLGIDVQRRWIQKDPRDALRDISVHAGAILLGTGGSARTGVLHAGRVTRTLMNHGYSPVFVVHGDAETMAGSARRTRRSLELE